ncbi:MAG: hypothetical protein ABS75_14095 [Pelagibacterium sp. SCN 63-23]|nr:MAG: hypothetical protein ABS75_14095 [Pelagibacterium sp. SCN 63-23]
MAENPGTQTPPTDPKLEEKTGPVRPPVLEGKARSTTGAKPAESSSAKKAEPPKPTPPKKPVEPAPAKSSGSPWLAGLLGGALGLGAAYGLAWFGLWPAQPQATPPADPRIAQFATAIPDLQTRSGSLQNELSALATRLASLESEMTAPPAASSDSDLADQVAALAARLETLAATPAMTPDSAQAESNATALDALETQLAQLQQQGTDTAARLSETESRLETLADQAAENQGVRLPFVFSALESAFAAGRPYDSELTALRQAWPEASVPQSVTANASAGLPRPEDVARRFNAAIPDMLAGRPANADASWQDGAMDWVRGVVAMRPMGEVEGDSPEAQVARLETAMARRDFVTARDALAALPQSMRNAASAVEPDIGLLAEAETFLTELRNDALTKENGL